MSWRRACVLAALFAFASSSTLAAGAATPADGAVSIGLVAPDGRSEDDDPRSMTYFVDDAAPGEVVRRRVEVANTTRSSANVSLYAAGADVTEAGGFTFAPDRTANELSSWTTISHPSLDLPPQHRALATVAIEVPVDAADGERYAVVWAEVRVGDGRNRVGLRIYLHVGAEASRSSYELGEPRHRGPEVQLPITNTGDRTLELSGTFIPAGEGDASRPFEQALTLLPGRRGVLQWTADDAGPARETRGVVVLEANGERRRHQLGDAGPEVGGRVPSSSGRAVPVGVATAMAASIVALMVRKRSRR